MQVKLTIGERLKDLRVERKLTLEQLSAAVGISKSALGKYESDNGKDISPYSISMLADYYGVSSDYLMGRTEIKNHPNTALHELHLGDDAIEVLRTCNFNHRLLSELICHKDFQRFMLDTEIYVDRIADMRIKDMNTVLEATRQMVLMEHGEEADDLYLHRLSCGKSCANRDARAPIGNPASKGAGLRWRPQSVKRFEALTEPTGETAPLCTPHIFFADRYPNCKMPFGIPAQKMQKKRCHHTTHVW